MQRSHSASEGQFDHPILNTRNFVILALVQVFIIVFSVLGAGLLQKILEGIRPSLLTLYYIHFGFLMLLIPLVWISTAAWLRMRSENPEAVLMTLFWIGLGIVIVLCILGVKAAITPLFNVTWGLGAGG